MANLVQQFQQLENVPRLEAFLPSATVITARQGDDAKRNHFNQMLLALFDWIEQFSRNAQHSKQYILNQISNLLPSFIVTKLVRRNENATVSKQENEDRGNWSNQIEFVISCVGNAVGLGNVWRFPYICYRNGGGAFILIYWILTILIGFPTMVAEQSIGQYTSQGPLHCWQYAPVISGIGISMFASSFLITVYYVIAIVWSTYYLFASFTTKLPWQQCDFSSWADYRCEMQRLDCLPGADHIRGADGLCYNWSMIISSSALRHPKDQRTILSMESLSTIVRNTSTVLGIWNESLASQLGINSALSTDQYYHNYVLGDGDEVVGWDNFGKPRWSLALCLLLVWAIIFLTLIKGVQSSGKVVYVTALAPYAVLLTLIIRGVTLPGAYEGIRYVFTPRFDLIATPDVWYEAAGQLFFSLSVCFGGMITMASYSRFQNNIIRDSLIVVAADTFTSTIASIAIFSVIGFGAHILDCPIDKVVEAGAGLAFIVYPKVLSQIPGAVGFSIIFFIMLICIGLSSLVNDVNTVYTSLLDLFPFLRKKARRLTLFCVCAVNFLIGLSFVCPGGPALMQIFDEYVATWAILLIGVLETTSLCWFYGFKRYTKDLRLMMPWIPSIPAYVVEVTLWGFVTPGILTFIMIFTWVAYQPRSSQLEEGIGWFLTWFVAIWMPATAIWVVATGKGTLRQRIVNAVSPTKKWGPYLDRFRKQASHLAAFSKPKETAIADISTSVDFKHATNNGQSQIELREVLHSNMKSNLNGNNGSSATLNSVATTVNSQVGIISDQSVDDFVARG